MSTNEPAGGNATPDVVARDPQTDPPTGTMRVRGATLFVLGLVGLTASLALWRSCGW